MVIDSDFLELVENGKMKQGNNFGCGIICYDPVTCKIPLAKRTDTHTYATAGGKVEVGETPKQGVIRECKEESNIKINSMVCYDYAAHTAPNGKNWLDFMFVSTDFDASKMKNQESEMEAFEWYTIDEALKLDLFPPSRKGLERLIESKILEGIVNFVNSEDNNSGNGYFPMLQDCEYYPQSWNPVDTEVCSYSYDPAFDW